MSTAWETDQLPPWWAASLNSHTGVVVPCNWNRAAILRDNVTTPTFSIPHPVPPALDDRNDDETRRWQHRVRRLLGLTTRDFVFYTIATWTSRKNLAMLIDVFQRCFRGRSNVVLVIKTSRYADDAPRFFGRFLPSKLVACAHRLSSGGGARIKVVTDAWRPEEITALHQVGHCFVSMSHGEGWGLGSFDAVCHGTPVIVPRHGGQLDYLPKHWPWWIDVELVPAAARGWETEIFLPSQTWARPLPEHTAELMLQMPDQLEEAQKQSAQVATDLRRQCSLERVGLGWREMLSAVSC